MKYPMIEKWMPKLMRRGFNGSDAFYLIATDLETELATATRIYGDSKTRELKYWSTESEPKYNTHEALIVGIQPLNRKVKRSDIEQFLRSELNDPSVADSEEYGDAIRLLERILENGVES